AVAMNDQALFDGLWGYWNQQIVGAGQPLMTWKVPGGSGSDTGADEDAAFALLQASRKWSGAYLSNALSVMHALLAYDVYNNTYIKGGSNYAAGAVTSPSYFAPAYYTEFAKVDSVNAATWNGLATAVYGTWLAGIGATSTNGLYPGWCGNNCTTAASNGGATDVLYQYDSHRIPWRIGFD